MSGVFLLRNCQMATEIEWKDLVWKNVIVYNGSRKFDHQVHYLDWWSKDPRKQLYGYSHNPIKKQKKKRIVQQLRKWSIKWSIKLLDVNMTWLKINQSVVLG